MFKVVGLGVIVTLLSNRVLCEITVSVGVVLAMLNVKIGRQIAITATVVFIITTMIRSLL